jgi:smad nuclear-interacting protein 1
VRVKQEPMTDDDASRRQRQQQSFQPRGGNRRNPREQDDNAYQWGKQIEKEKEAPVEKEKPNFGLSGALLKDTNTYKGVVIKYSEPMEARKPKRKWRLYVFKGDQV